MYLTILLIGLGVLALAGIIWACWGYPESELDFAIAFLIERRRVIKAYHALIDTAEGTPAKSGAKRYRYCPEILTLEQNLKQAVPYGDAVKRIPRMAKMTPLPSKRRTIATLLAESKQSQDLVRQRLLDVIPKMKAIELTSSGEYVEVPE
jgi:hypothetical protein